MRLHLLAALVATMISPASAQEMDPDREIALEKTYTRWACEQRIKEYMVSPSTFRVTRAWITKEGIHKGSQSEDWPGDPAYMWEIEFDAMNRMGVPIRDSWGCLAVIFSDGLGIKLSWDDMTSDDRAEQADRYIDDIIDDRTNLMESMRRAHQRAFLVQQ